MNLPVEPDQKESPEMHKGVQCLSKEQLVSGRKKVSKRNARLALRAILLYENDTQLCDPV